MKTLTKICLAMSLAIIPLVSAATVDNRLTPEVESIIEQQKQNPVFWASWSNEISRYYGKPDLYKISRVKNQGTTIQKTPRLMSTEEYVRETVKNYNLSLPIPHKFLKEYRNKKFY